MSPRPHKVEQSRITGRFLFASVLVLGAGLARPASAHFVLQTPASWWSQDGNGGPQKAPPCGNMNTPQEPLGTASNIVTPYNFPPGSPRTINITVNETIGHPGHYRVALAQNQATLPAEPTVTPSTADPCASAAIQTATTTPTVPAVLGDNLSPKTTARMGVQNFSVTVPEGLTCTNCTLQVIEFMSSHGLNVPGGCFYHHCANITITNNAGGGGAAATGGAGTGGRGTGGAAGRAGGASSGGATASGGATGTGGAPRSGGATASGGGTASGGATGTGGATVVDAGSSTGGAGTTADSGSGGNGANDSNGGCACAIAWRGRGELGAGLLFLGFGAWVLLRRTRRRR